MSFLFHEEKLPVVSRCRVWPRIRAGKTGFTLIELLVVIAIIALLMAVIMPALRAAKELASGAVCTSNQKNLCLAWLAYAEENDALLVGGSTYHIGTHPTPYRWVERPLYKETDNPEKTSYPSSGEFTLEYRKNGIRAGKLFPYTGDVDLYHCPGDRSFTKDEPLGVYRSYAITGLMNGEDFVKRAGGLYSPIETYRSVSAFGAAKTLFVATKTTEITSPGSKHVFVEEDVSAKGQVFNLGGFVLLGKGGQYYWWDWPAFYHNDSSTIGFADGHAERHKWQDSDTIKLMKGEISADPDPQNNVDLSWMIKGYIP